MNLKYHHRNQAFTLIELLVVIAIIAVLAGLGMMGLNKARESSNTVKCAGNLRQLGVAINLYANENSGKYPISAQHTTGFTGVWWWDLTRPYLSSPFDPTFLSHPDPKVRAKGSTKTVLLCPSLKIDISGSQSSWPNIGYAINGYTLPLQGDTSNGTRSLNVNPATTFVLADSAYWFAGGWYGPKLADEFTFRHNDMANVLLLDGHVERFTKKQLQDTQVDRRLKGL